VLSNKEDISSSDEYEVSDNEIERVLFMAVEDSDKEDFKEEYEEIPKKNMKKSKKKLKRQKLTTERN
jgi:hypothetical protein